MGSGFKDWAAGDILTAADVDGYLMRQAVMTFADASARDSALSGVLDEGMMAYLEDSNLLTTYDGSAWIVTGNAGAAGYRYVDTVYFTANGTFSKASYPYLRAIKVMLVGGGGGSAGAAPLGAGGGGGGGGYAEAFITDIAGLASSVTVTVGNGGTGGAAGDNAGNNGGTTSFGSAVSATGGAGASNQAGDPQGGSAGIGSVGDLLLQGSGGGFALGRQSGIGGSSHLGGGGRSVYKTGSGSINGQLGGNYGGGGGGPSSVDNNVAGQAGAPGIVIVELYA